MVYIMTICRCWAVRTLRTPKFFSPEFSLQNFRVWPDAASTLPKNSLLLFSCSHTILLAPLCPIYGAHTIEGNVCSRPHNMYSQCTQLFSPIRTGGARVYRGYFLQVLARTHHACSQYVSIYTVALDVTTPTCRCEYDPTCQYSYIKLRTLILIRMRLICALEKHQYHTRDVQIVSPIQAPKFVTRYIGKNTTHIAAV